MSRQIPTLGLAALLCACGAREGQAQGAQTPPAPPARQGQALETRPPEGRKQQPAFPGQTRAPERRADVPLEATPVATGLDHPWGMVFLPGGDLLISERPGRLRILHEGKLSGPVAGLPPVDARAQGGLLGLAVDPHYAQNGLIYFAFSERDPKGGNHTAVARGRLVSTTSGATLLEGVQVIFRQTPSLDSTMHFGGRLAFAPDGTLFVTLGERSIIPGRMQAERLDGDLGKVVRINPDGSIPKDNPLVGRPGARPEIWSIGHRNIQAGAVNPRTGKLWTIEHGARGGDEINIPQAGKDYGWPTIAYGIEYAGGPIGQGITSKPGLEQPIYYWDPVIAPSGMAFYQADLVPAWKGSLFVGGLKAQTLVRLTLDGDRVVGEEHLLTDLGERIRDVIVGPDGALYVATDAADGRVLRVAPRA